MVRNRTLYERICRYCQRKFTTVVRQQPYCSSSCAAIVNGHLYPKRIKLKVRKNCIICGILCKSPYAQFCSNSCAKQQRYTDYIYRWKQGEETGGTKHQISPYVKNFLLEKYGNKCSKCGWNEINPITNRSPLQVNHIDGDGENHKEDNLEILCPNCHALTPNFGALNLGKGRKYRRDKYRKIGE